ncbi:uncharacterized protein LOC134784178 [Penaeus indicus]|uniref:uncharacterized protein LOC134784178 n=1 Tax=Penaeus indicus TaxID=29960 RepID=UPI00300D1416
MVPPTVPSDPAQGSVIKGDSKIDNENAGTSSIDDVQPDRRMAVTSGLWLPYQERIRLKKLAQRRAKNQQRSRDLTLATLNVGSMTARKMASIEGQTVNVASAYAPQTRRKTKRKRLLSDYLHTVTPSERLWLGGDLNGHVGTDIRGMEGHMGNHGYGDMNEQGEQIRSIAEAADLAIINTYFSKLNSQKVTYSILDSKEGQSMAIRIAKRRDKNSADVRQIKVIKDEDGQTLTDDAEIKERWRAYFRKLLNEENPREEIVVPSGNERIVRRVTQGVR